MLLLTPMIARISYGRHGEYGDTRSPSLHQSYLNRITFSFVIKTLDP